VAVACQTWVGIGDKSRNVELLTGDAARLAEIGYRLVSVVERSDRTGAGWLVFSIRPGVTDPRRSLRPCRDPRAPPGELTLRRRSGSRAGWRVSSGR
jgi:hypothetical protein